MVSLSEAYIINDNPIGLQNANMSWSFSGTTSRGTSSSISTTQQHTFGISIAVSAGGKFGLPFVAEGEISTTVTGSYQYQTATTNMQDSSDSQQFTWSQGSPLSTNLLPPGYAQHCIASAMQGTFEEDYTSTVQVTVNGKIYTFHQRGTFSSVSWSNVNTRCTLVLASGVPEGANVTTGTVVAGQGTATNSTKMRRRLDRRALDFSA